MGARGIPDQGLVSFYSDLITVHPTEGTITIVNPNNNTYVEKGFQQTDYEIIIEANSINGTQFTRTLQATIIHECMLAKIHWGDRDLVTNYQVAE